MRERIHPILWWVANYNEETWLYFLSNASSNNWWVYREDYLFALWFIEKKECNHSYKWYTVDWRKLIDPACQKCGEIYLIGNNNDKDRHHNRGMKTDNISWARHSKSYWEIS